MDLEHSKKDLTSVRRVLWSQKANLYMECAIHRKSLFPLILFMTQL